MCRRGKHFRFIDQKKISLAFFFCSHLGKKYPSSLSVHYTDKMFRKCTSRMLLQSTGRIKAQDFTSPGEEDHKQSEREMQDSLKRTRKEAMKTELRFTRIVPDSTCLICLVIRPRREIAGKKNTSACVIRILCTIFARARARFCLSRIKTAIHHRWNEIGNTRSLATLLVARRRLNVREETKAAN